MSFGEGCCIPQVGVLFNRSANNLASALLVFVDDIQHDEAGLTIDEKLKSFAAVQFDSSVEDFSGRRIASGGDGVGRPDAMIFVEFDRSALLCFGIDFDHRFPQEGVLFGDAAQEGCEIA